METKQITIGYASLCMAEFDAILDVVDVRAQADEVPEYSEPPNAQSLKNWLAGQGHVVDAKLVGDVGAAQRANNLFKTEQVDVLVLYEFGFTLATTFMALMRGLDKVPVVFWNTQIKRRMEHDMEFGTVMANNSVSSIPHSTNVLFQANHPFAVITGDLADASAARRFKQIFTAVKAKKKLSQARIGSIGYPYPGMATITINETEFSRYFGVEVVHVNPFNIGKAHRAADRARTEEALKILKSRFAVSGLGDDELTRSAAFYAAFQDVIKEERLDAFALLCTLLILEEDLGVAPCFALSLLSEQGIHTTCEGDIPSAAAMIIAQEIAGNAHFSEFYMMDMERELVLMGHCGYGNCALANKKHQPRIVPQPCFPGPGGRGAALEYTMAPGDITVISVTSAPPGFKLIAVEAECVDIEAFRIGCPQVVFRFKNHSLAEGVERYCKAGGAHHMAVCQGIVTEELSLLAEMLNVGFEQV
jgi:L-arabinose isomerase